MRFWSSSCQIAPLMHPNSRITGGWIVSRGAVRFPFQISLGSLESCCSLMHCDSPTAPGFNSEECMTQKELGWRKSGSHSQVSFNTCNSSFCCIAIDSSTSQWRIRRKNVALYSSTFCNISLVSALATYVSMKQTRRHPEYSWWSLTDQPIMTHQTGCNYSRHI